MLVSSFIGGCVRAFGGPAYESLLPTLMGKEHLPNAIALNSVQFNVAQVIGPGVAGAALGAFGTVRVLRVEQHFLPVRNRSNLDVA